MEFTNSVVGGIFVNTASRSTIEFENCVFRNITGGAIVVDSAADIIIRNCTFENVDSDYGSAIKVNNNDASVKITDTKFVNTKAKADFDAVNTKDSILTISFKSKENYIGAIYSLGNVQLNNVEYWDGTKEGRPCKQDTYVWLIRCVTKDGIRLPEQSGTVTLLR